MAGKSRILLVAGLGNPGPEYAGTRHNAGFMAADFLAGPAADWRKEKNYEFSIINFQSSIIFIKPQTFMNSSGIAVLSAMSKYGIPLENLTVIHDDIDLTIGDVRIKTGGGNAGHNGLRSITASVGNDYRRIRLGVGRPADSRIDIIDWVLGKFPSADLKILAESIKNIRLFKPAAAGGDAAIRQ